MPFLGYSNYRPVNSRNELPLTEFAGGVAYRKELFIEMPRNIANSYILTGSFKNRIRDSADPNSTILLEQEVEWRAMIMAVGGLATWMPLDEGTGKITTTIVNGEAIDPAVGWQHVDVTNQTEFSETMGYTEFDPVGVVGIFGYSFMATWYSPPYRVDVPPGAVLQRVYDRWGIGTLDSRATFAFSFRAGAPFVSNWLDDFRASRAATPSGIYTQINFSYPVAGYNKPVRRMRLALRGAVIMKDRHNRLFVAGDDGNNYRLFCSYDDGRSFEPMSYEFTPITNMPIWNSGETNRDLTTDGRGGFYTIAQQGTRILMRQSVDGVLWSAPRFVANRRRAEPYMIRYSPRTDELIISNGDLSHVLRSRDNGRSWEDFSP